jgi:hypothetical protein
LQELWDEHDHKAFSKLMKACMKDSKTKKLTETEDFENALTLLTRLEEGYLSDAERQKGVAWSKLFDFTAHASESGMDLVTRFGGIVRQLQNLGEPVTPAQLYHRFLESSLLSKGTHHQLLATAIYTNPAPLTYEQMKVRFEKSALQVANLPAPAPAAVDVALAPAPGPAPDEVEYVSSSESQSHSHGAGNQRGQNFRCNICSSKNHFPKNFPLKAQVAELVQRHKRDLYKSNGNSRNAKK